MFFHALSTFAGSLEDVDLAAQQICLIVILVF